VMKSSTNCFKKVWSRATAAALGAAAAEGRTPIMLPRLLAAAPALALKLPALKLPALKLPGLLLTRAKLPPVLVSLAAPEPEPPPAAGVPGCAWPARPVAFSTNVSTGAYTAGAR
jgi:hypothetical protein